MYRDIIVCINEAEGRDKAILAAARYAKELGANLTGLYVKQSTRVYGSSYGLSPYGMVYTDLVKLTEERDAELTAKASEVFRNIVDDIQSR